MNYDLDTIKKKYGEKMSHLCRELFPTLLEVEGLLSKLLLDNFKESRHLYKDIIANGLEYDFRNYIQSLINVEVVNIIDVDKTPKELLEEVGYDLYECKTEEEIQYFKKYYAQGEELCTFKGDRLDRCYVFFAVKKNAEQIKRAEFPRRQDEYGTSVISIQFTKNQFHNLSIKNRYNHTVINPDATFSNNLENIVPGLTQSFEKHYGFAQQNADKTFEIQGYVKANDKKSYKYNYEENNIYYCSDNIIIDNFEVKQYDKSKYLVIDYFIIDLVNKKVELYDKSLDDSFVDIFKDINKINIKNFGDNKRIEIISKDNKKIEITVDMYGRIIGLFSENIESLGNKFLYINEKLNYFVFPNLKSVGNSFLENNNGLEKLSLDSLEQAGDFFLATNTSLMELSANKLKKVGDFFLNSNKEMTNMNVLSLEKVGSRFLSGNRKLKYFVAPNLLSVGDCCLMCNEEMIRFIAPNLISVGNKFMIKNKIIKEMNISSLTKVGREFLTLLPLRDMLLKKIDKKSVVHKGR